MAGDMVRKGQATVAASLPYWAWPAWTPVEGAVRPCLPPAALSFHRFACLPACLIPAAGGPPKEAGSVASRGRFLAFTFTPALGSDLLDEQDAGLQLLDGMYKQLPADELEALLRLQRQNHSELSPQGSRHGCGCDAHLSWGQWRPLRPSKPGPSPGPNHTTTSAEGSLSPPKISSPSSWAQGCPARGHPRIRSARCGHAKKHRGMTRA